MCYSFAYPFSVDTFKEPDNNFPALDILEVKKQIINCISYLNNSQVENSEKIALGLLKNIRHKFKYSTQFVEAPPLNQINCYLRIVTKIKFFYETFLQRKSSPEIPSVNPHKHVVDKTLAIVFNSFIVRCQLELLPYINSEYLAYGVSGQTLRVCDQIILLEIFNRSVVLFREIFQSNTSTQYRLKENKCILKAAYKENNTKLEILYSNLRESFVRFTKNGQHSERKKIILKFRNLRKLVESFSFQDRLNAVRSSFMISLRHYEKTVFSECDVYEQFTQNPQLHFHNFKGRLLNSLSWLEALIEATQKESPNYDIKAENVLQFLEGKRFYDHFYVLKVNNAYELIPEQWIVLHFIEKPQDPQAQSHFISMIKFYLFELFNDHELGLKSLNKHDTLYALNLKNEELRTLSTSHKTRASKEDRYNLYTFAENFNTLISEQIFSSEKGISIKAHVNASGNVEFKLNTHSIKTM